MPPSAPVGFTAAEYLALERASERKHEFVAGAIVAMAGARPPHNILAANVTSALVALGRHHNDPPSLLNPTLLVEVTSESTEDYDRGSKFLHY